MKIKKNWSQFKEPQAPLTQSAPDRSSPASSELPDDASGLPDDNTNNNDDIKVLPLLNDEELSGNESDNGSDDEELSEDQMRENFLAEKLKEKGIDIPLPFKKKSNTMANNNTGQNVKPVRKSRIIKPKGLTEFLPGIFSDSSSLMAITAGTALVVATCLMKKNFTSTLLGYVGQNNQWRVY